jgi:hypothetical protein
MSFSRWIVGMDVGQSIDPSAIAVLQVQTRGDVHRQYYASPPDTPGLVEPPKDWYARFGDVTRVADPLAVARIDVRHLERLPLRMNYLDQIAHVSQLLNRAPLAQYRPAFVLDMTGVGRPVIDLFRHARLRPVGITITAGDGESRTDAGDYRVAKLLLVSRLQAAFHSGALRISKHLAEAQTFVHELQDFRANISESGVTRFGARESRHDDLILAVAIAAYWASAQRTASTFTHTM